MVNRHFILFALAFAAALSGVAKTFDVDISTGRPAASNEAYYHGETIEFRAVRGRSVVTNVEYSCVYYQTNGMDSVWWHTDGLVFHPTNDVGAASYRFFLEGRDDLGRDWHANGLLRLLPSPGFTPNTIELPVARLDFAAVDVLNPPWTDPDYSTNNTVLVDTIEATATAPGNYAAVSNAAVHAAITNALQDAALASLSDTKADKPASFTAGNLTKFDANGNPIDSFIAVTNVALKTDISPTEPAFSNAVLAVGLGIDTNTVAVINELVDSTHSLPLTGATSVGVLLLALAAAIAALKRGKLDSLEAIAWSDLKAKRDGGNLVPGQQYRITDYVATTNGDMESQSANHPFDIIVTADDEHTLNEHARAIMHDGDTYFAGCDLAAWDVWYCLDNDTTRFMWADSTNGKGVIYRLVDEFQNDVPYDFKGIQFLAYGDADNVYRYTFDSGDASNNADLSLAGINSIIYSNEINPYFDDGKQKLNRIVFKGWNCFSNKFGSYCSSNTFGDGCSFNTFGLGCGDNTFGSHCYFNTFGLDCQDIKFGNASVTKSYCRYIRVGSGNRYLYINPTGTTSDSRYYRNVEIKEGVNNTNTYKTIDDPNVGQTFLTTYKPANSQEVSL